jgi:hypothetical protein
MLTGYSFINNMLEITTGVVFLMSSMYGSGQAYVHSPQMNVADTETVATSTEQQGTFDNSKNVESYLRKAYADQPLLVEIARCESTFRQFGDNGKVIRGRVNDDDIGVMQINEMYHGETADRMGIDIYTIEGNVAFAKYLYGKYGSKPWSSSAPCWSKSIAQGDLARK